MNSELTVIIGAGYAGLGYAAAHPDVLILEHSESVGADYHAFLRPTDRIEPPLTLQGKDLYRFLEQYGIIMENRLDVLRLSTAICRYVQNQPWCNGIRLDAQLISIQKQGNMFEIIYHTNSGIHCVEAARILDVTGNCISDRTAITVKDKLLHVVCTEVTDDFRESLLKVDSELVFTPGFHEGEWTITFRFAPEITLPQARERIETVWHAAFPSGAVLIDAVGFDFDMVAVKERCPKTIWLPPHHYRTPLEAFDAGCMRGEAWNEIL